MKQSEDAKTFQDAMRALAESPKERLREAQNKAKEADELLFIPGVALKGRNYTSLFDRDFGILAKAEWDKDEFTVVSVPGIDPVCTWTGNEEEYKKMWMVD